MSMRCLPMQTFKFVDAHDGVGRVDARLLLQCYHVHFYLRSVACMVLTVKFRARVQSLGCGIWV